MDLYNGDMELKEIQTLEGHTDRKHTRTVRSCAWSPSGKLLATPSFDDTTAIWEINGGDFEGVAALEGHENEVKSVPWNASGSLLQTCSWDKTVWIWEVMPGNEFECVFRFFQGHLEWSNGIQPWMFCLAMISSLSSTLRALSFDDEGDRMVTEQMNREEGKTEVP
ncbi:hypothetical protein POTOM_048464 [Populus tomentosa]|uniref:Cytosolic iron-sulfur protein assembly protein CIAO1 homolog n=1 Tax=Populus tomentosa TaxID=118781 RepID=A0A8X8C4L9_POPTO|nr:hypothetical protein POTOM_048464 [Populus tomentosa]